MILRALLCLVLPLASARAEDAIITIGGKALRIPAPASFQRYDGKSDKIDGMQASFVPPSNHIMAAYAEPADVAKVLAGKFPRLTRSFNVQENWQYEQEVVTPGDFASLQMALREQMDVLKSTSGSVTEVEKNAASAMSQALDSNLKVKVGEVLPQGVFGETPTATCFSMLVKSRMMGKPLDDPIDPTTVIAGCVMLVQDRLLYLYANSSYEGKKDAAWTRAQIVAWRDAVEAANAVAVPKKEIAPPPEPSEPVEPAGEDEPAPPPWWNKAVAIIPAAGAALVLGFFLIRRGTAKRTS